MPILKSQEKIYVVGHRGMVDSAIVRSLQKQGETNIVTRKHAELDLTNQAAVESFLRKKSLSNYASPPPRWAASMRIIPIRQTVLSS